jgi:ribosome modulation factor
MDFIALWNDRLERLMQQDGTGMIAGKADKRCPRFRRRPWFVRFRTAGKGFRH